MVTLGFESLPACDSRSLRCVIWCFAHYSLCGQSAYQANDYALGNPDYTVREKLQ